MSTMSCTEIILLAPTSSEITPSQTRKNAVSLDLSVGRVKQKGRVTITGEVNGEYDPLEEPDCLQIDVRSLEQHLVASRDQRSQDDLPCYGHALSQGSIAQIPMAPHRDPRN